jgi:DNA-binding IclR family transcriptional regulator
MTTGRDMDAILAALRLGPGDHRTLADRAGLEVSAALAALGHLVADGLARQDGRLIAITDKGRAAA